VMFFPNGIAGVWEKYGQRLTDPITKSRWIASLVTLIQSKTAKPAKDVK